MNRTFTNLLTLIIVTASWIAGIAYQSILAVVIGHLLVFAPACIAFFIHRYWFSTILKIHGLRLISFHNRRGFQNYMDQPWWKWIVGYDGVVTRESGQLIGCWFCAIGPLFALIDPELICEAEPDSDGALPFAPITLNWQEADT